MEKAVKVQKETNKLNELKKVRAVSLLVSLCNYQTAIEQIVGLVKAGNGGYVCFSTVHMVMESYDNPEFGKKVNSADMIVPDGMPLVWMQKLQGLKDADRVRANSIMRMLFEHCEANNLSVGFYGGKQEVIDEIQVKAKKEFPKLKIAYTLSPPFRPLTEEEDIEITAEINRTKPDILFMGLGCPKQENWMFAHKDKVKAIMLGVGASFDFYAGNIKECPEWLQKLGLEWFYRLLQEPKRLWRRYIILNPRFIWLATTQLLGFKKFE